MAANKPHQQQRKSLLSALGFDSKIAQRLFRWCLFIGFVIMCITMPLDLIKEYNHQHDYVEQQLKVIGTTFSPTLTKSAWDLDLQQIEVAMNSIAQMPYISLAQIQLENEAIKKFGADVNTNNLITQQFPLSHSEAGQEFYLGQLTLINNFDIEETQIVASWLTRSVFSIVSILIIAIAVVVIYQLVVNKRLIDLHHKMKGINVQRLMYSRPDFEYDDSQNDDELDELARAIENVWVTGGDALINFSESEERWRFAMDGAQQGLWDLNLDTNKIFFSTNWKNILGYELSEITDDVNEWWDRIHPDDRTKTENAFDDHLKKLTPLYEVNHRIKTKSGDYVSVLERGKVTSINIEGKPTRIIGTMTKLT